MKQCPKCDRIYIDETLNFCLDDGEWLQTSTEPATAILPDSPSSGEAATRAQIHATDQSAVLPTANADRERPSRNYTLLGVSVLGVVVIGLLAFVYLKQAQGRQINSVAVMPFVNESGDPQLEYLTDGMTDTLIRSLSELPTVRVKARTSVFRYKGKQIDPKAIGSELSVQAIVNGRVVQRDGRTNVSIEVVDTETEDVIYSTSYNKVESELVTLQSDIARDVSGKLARKLSGSDEAKVSKTYTTDPEAYQRYLKGDFYWHKRGKGGLLQAADYFNKAIEKDPGYALAYAGLALTYAIYPDYSVASPADSFPRAKAAALRASELDGSLAEAHTVLGDYYALWEWDFAKSEQEYRRAIELNPNYATAHHWLSLDVLCNLKRFDEAIAEAKKAQDLDPLSSIITTNLGDNYQYARRYEEAIATYRRAQEIDPTFYYPHYALGAVLSIKGQYPEAIMSFQKALELGSGPYVQGLLAYALARAGQRDEAMKLVEEIKHQSADKYVPGDALAYAYLGLGNKDETLVWLEKAVDQHSREALLLGVDPLLDDLRGEPHFQALLKRVNLPE